MHRFFISPQALKGTNIYLGQDFAHRLGRVLRLCPGDDVIFLDNSGWEYAAQLTHISQTLVEALVTGRKQSGGEASIRIHLFQSLLKLDKFELVLQKGVEMGVASFTPLISSRSITPAPQSGRQNRWQRIILEAAEQSQRGRLPPLNTAITLELALAEANGHIILPWEGENTTGLRHAIMSLQSSELQPVLDISLFIGPEGGWADEEISLARRHGAVIVSLGARILRAETAGMAAAAAILYHYGELGM